MTQPAVNTNARWWEREPYLACEVSLATTPGLGPTEGWQEHADPDEEVRIVASSHALQAHLLHAAHVHTTDAIGYFKSETFLKQGHDYLGDYLQRSRAVGYRTIVYLNIHALRPDFAKRHPFWLQMRRDGRPMDGLPDGDAAMCVNTAFRDWVRTLCLDLCKYPVDGIFLDGPVFAADCCHCAMCRRSYQKEFGTPLPPHEPSHPELKKLAAFQAETLRRFFDVVNQAVKAARPDVVLFSRGAAREEPYALAGRNNRITIQALDVLGAEGGGAYGALFAQPVWRPGCNAKYYQTQAGAKPTVIFCSPVRGLWPSYCQSEAELLLAFAQGPLHGSGSLLRTFNGFQSQAAFARLAEDFRFFSRHHDAYFRTRSLARVAIVWPADSLSFYVAPPVIPSESTQRGEPGERAGDIGEEFNGFYDALVRNQRPCDVIDEEVVRTADLSPYDLIVLPNVACTGETFDSRIREFVKSGGRVIASFETSLCAADGVRRTDLALADLLGVRLMRSPIKPFPHYYFLRDPAWPQVFADIDAPYLPAPVVCCDIRTDGAVPISAYSEKIKGWDGRPIEPSKFPALTTRECGRGIVVYLAGAFGAHYWGHRQKDIRLLFRNLFAWLSTRTIEIIGAPPSVEVTHRQTIDGAWEIVSLINYTGGQTRPFEDVTPLQNLVVRVRTRRVTVRALRLGRDLPVRREGEWGVVALPKLELFETLVWT